jgi:cytochrome c551/c552
MRTTKPQSRDLLRAATPSALAGSEIFDRVGCAFCHVLSIVTAAAGTRLFGVDNNFDGQKKQLIEFLRSL